ncbi:MAG: response regulator [SAR324 cluster bacterium]|nr:response regulator [SAR324 cluster bacterium]MBF0349730.1 response regulator [SAR324 cluster bacterium]
MALSAANLINSIYNDRVLLLEGNEVMRRFYEEHLEFSGFEVHCATTQEEAYNILEYVPVNLIVCNEYLESRNNIPFIVRLRKKHNSSNILILTSNEDRVWELLPEDPYIQTFPVPENIDEFLKGDINQFVSLVAMSLVERTGILLVNDNSNERMEIENILISNNYRICSVNSGQEGLSMIQRALRTRYQIHLTILDIFNRYYPGLRFLEDLSRDYPELPIILLTSVEVSQEKLDRIHQHNNVKVLLKKDISAMLLPHIRTLLSGSV